MKTGFEKKLEEHGFSYYNIDDLYSLVRRDEPNRTIKAQFISSEPVDESAVGSRNGNSLKAIGHFKFRLPIKVNEPDFYIFAFNNSETHSIEYIIIPSKYIKRRLAEENRIASGNEGIELVFWLLPDNNLYETKDKGLEWERYYLSKGVGRRMVDQTDWDYSEFKNDWNRLKMK